MASSEVVHLAGSAHGPGRTRQVAVPLGSLNTWIGAECALTLWVRRREAVPLLPAGSAAACDQTLLPLRKAGGWAEAGDEA